ncbi:MAG: hypothetical protein ACYCPW_08380 [Nitrososphaerales archaeon]
MPTIEVAELDSLEASVMKYIVYNLGVNIVPRTAEFDNEGKVWKVPLDAIVPNRVSRKDGRTRTFMYNFDNVGVVKLEERDKNVFGISDATKAYQIDEMITKRFSDLTAEIEQEILVAGESSWGKLRWVSILLGPLYSIVTNILVRGEVPVQYIYEKDYIRWADLLIKEGFVGGEGAKSLFATNKLTKLQERLFDSHMASTDFDVAQSVVGSVFSRRYSTIKNEMRIYAPTAYVDATKVYYTDAVQYGEIIPISEEELHKKYIRIGMRQVLTYADFSFMTLVSELVSAKLLVRENDDIVGVPEVFKNVMQLKENLMANITETRT